MKPIRWSLLKNFAQSAAHYKAALDGERTETAAMRIGSATDAYIFNSATVAVYDGVRRGAKWETFCEDNAGALLINISEYDAARPVADAVLAHPLAMSLLEGEHRSELRWSYLGRECVSHPDVYNRTGRFLSDLKTGMTSDPNRYPRHAAKLLYHSQAAMYRMAIEEAEGWAPADCYNVVAEQRAPHVVTVFRITDRALLMGQKACRSWMEQLLNCEAAGEFHGYTQAVVDFDIEDYDDELTFADEVSGAELLEQIG